MRLFELGATLAIALVCASLSAAEPWKRHTIDDSSRGADGARLADVNGDGHLDIATAWEEGGIIRAYLNPGTAEVRSKWPAVTVGRVGSPEDAVFVDLDGDGAVDVVSSCEGRTRTMYVHWAPKEATKYLDAGAWKTEAFSATEKKQSWMFALPMDIDGQHGTDLMVGSKGGGAAVGWLQSPADPRNVTGWTYHQIYPAGWIMSLEPLDVDADGDLDVVVSDRRGANRGAYWLENPGTKAAAKGAAWRRHDVGASNREVMFLGLSKQGSTPRVAVALKPTEFSIFTTPADLGRKWSQATWQLPNKDIGTAKSVQVADIDGDGRDDVICSCEHAKPPKSGVFYFSPKGNDPGPIHNISGPRGIKFDLIRLLDLDRDGDLDVITCEERHNLGVIWYENPAR